MSKGKKTLGLSRITIIYFEVFLVLLTVIVIVAWQFLSDYQRNLPSQLSSEITAAIETQDMVALKSIRSNLPVSVKHKAIFNLYLKEFGPNIELDFYNGTSKKDNQKVVNITNNDKKMATLTLEKTGDKSFFGFEKYRVVNIVFVPVHHYTIITPPGVDIMINDVPLTDLTKELVKQPVTAFTQSAFGSIETQTYKLTGFQYIGWLTLPNNPNVEIIKDEDQETFSLILRPELTIQNEMADFGLMALKAHTLFATKVGIQKSSIMQYVYPGSQLQKNLDNYNNDYKYYYSNDQYDNIKIQNYVQYGPVEFSVDISLTYHIHNWNKTFDRDYHVAYKMYMTNINGKWQLTQMTPFIQE